MHQDRHEETRRQITFIGFLVLASIAFGAWQQSIMAGCFMFFALYLLAP